MNLPRQSIQCPDDSSEVILQSGMTHPFFITAANGQDQNQNLSMRQSNIVTLQSAIREDHYLVCVASNKASGEVQIRLLSKSDPHFDIMTGKNYFE